VIHVTDHEPEIERRRQQLEQTEQGGRVRPARARHDNAPSLQTRTVRRALREQRVQRCTHQTERTRDCGMTRWHVLACCDSTSRPVSTLRRAAPLTSEDLRLVLDDPLSLESVADIAQVVLELPQQAFVEVARNLTSERRLDLLLAHASPEQLTSLFDLDVWTRDRVDIPRARTWLAAIVDCYELAGRERGDLTDLMHDMDPEMWTLAITPGTVVIELDAEEDDSLDQALAELDGLHRYETPDGAFVVGVPDDEVGRLAVRVIDRVYADSLSAGARLVRSVSSALVSPLEEDLLRWRSGRLAELGFVEWEEAMRLFRPLDRDAAAQSTEVTQVFVPDSGPVQDLVSWSGAELLARAMERLSAQEHGLRSRQFLLLVNELMAAQHFDPGDAKAQERAVDQARATVQLGLEMLAGAKPGHPDPEAFLAERVTVLGLRQVFRVGYGALDKLRRAALALHREGRISLDRVGSLLDRPFGPAAAALSAWYPELPVASTSTGTRPLRGLGDVALATALIARAGGLASLTFDPRGYAVDPIWITRVDEPSRLTLGDLVRTAMVHAQLPGSKTTMAPLDRQQVAWAQANLLSSGTLVGAVAEDLRARCADLEISSHYEALSKNLLTRLEVELASVELDDGLPDLTRTGGLLTVQTVSMWLTSRSQDPPS
jgi:hypothetical protein